MKTRVVLVGLRILFAASLAFGAGQRQQKTPVHKVGGDVTAPRPISNPVPPPPEGVSKGKKVRASFLVLTDGSVSDVRFEHRSKTILDDYAVSTLSKWKFQPAEREGKPVIVRLETEFSASKQ